MGALIAFVAIILAACQRYGQPGSASALAEAIPETPDYNWDVRPILSQNCFKCHGHDPKHRKAGLRLDIGEGGAFAALADSPGKQAIVPGDPDGSELIRRITATDPEVRMPPREEHRVLTPREVAILSRWIEQGAAYKPHWAYIPPAETKPEATAWDARATGMIDRFVHARLAKEGLEPSAEADRETLVNRVTLDLTGLPPTLAEVDAFVADRSPQAYAKLVSRLLASRAYAERQANIWLDVARYADSDGFLNDGFGRFQYPYRDWVISAFARNLPYDRFVTWQLAGDLLPRPTREQILATAFARAGKKSNEAGIIDEEYRVEYVNERAELVGKAFLGLTVGCAKCHDHKYDVISQADYYSLGGFFNSVDERGIAAGVGWGPTLAWPAPSQARALSAARRAVAERTAARDAALAAARRDAAPAVEATLRAGAAAKVAAGATGLAQQAYYPMESGSRGSLAPLLIANNPKRPDPFAAKPGAPVAPDLPRLASREIETLVAAAAARGESVTGGTMIPKGQRYLIGISEAALRWSADPTAATRPAAINNLHSIAGPPGKGKAILIDDTIAFADRSVGHFERTQPFTLDIWVKLRGDKPYDSINILYNADRNNGAGYQLSLENNVLHFGLANAQPYNMLEIAMRRPLPRGRWLHLTATYDGSSRASGARLYVGGRPMATEVLHDRLTRTIVPRGGSNTFGSYTGLSFGRQFGLPEFNKGGVDELRVFTRALTPLEVALLHDPRLRGAFAPAAIRANLLAIAAAADPRVIEAEAALRAAREREQGIETLVPQIAVLGDRMKPRPTYLLANGIYDQHRQRVPVQGLAQVFPWDRRLPRNRVGLARWLFDPRNPLTARVYVNRLWQQHFGTGLVETVEDFGTQGANPTNPALLDWLAIEFRRSGWNIRHMHRLIVMSATYRQSSNVTKPLLDKDPRNLLLARGPRYRLPAEAIRDGALAASGLLVDRPGGDSVFPYQPQGVWDSTGLGYQPYPDAVPADELHRRSMYSFVKRNAQPPSLAVFDFADRNVATVARKISNTPLQALVLLNDPQYREAYRKLAERVIVAGLPEDRRIVALFRLATRRHPSPRELAALGRFAAGQRAYMTTRPDEVRRTLAIGAAPVAAGVDRVELAALTMVAATIMNSPDAYTLR